MRCVEAGNCTDRPAEGQRTWIIYPQEEPLPPIAGRPEHSLRLPLLLHASALLYLALVATRLPGSLEGQVGPLLALGGLALSWWNTVRQTRIAALRAQVGRAWQWRREIN